MSATAISYVNGERADSVSAQERGLAYGDGLFETMAWRDGAIRYFSRHYARLLRGCKALRLTPPAAAELHGQIVAACVGRRRAVVKLVFTRGPGPRGYRPPRSGRPTQLLQIEDWRDFPQRHYRRGVRLRMCRTPISLDTPRLVGLKHLNRLPQVLARMEWSSAAIHEGLMLDPRGAIIGGTMSNLFVARGGRLATPRLDRCGVAGVMRSVVMHQAARLGRPVVERRLTLEALAGCDEIFITNALIGLWPVRRLDEYRYRPGPLARQLLAALDLAPGTPA